MSAILRPDFPAKPHRIPAAGATPSDIAFTADRVDLIFNLALGALQGQLENLRENLPISSLNNFNDIYGSLRDLRNETLGRLEKIEGDLS
jgi:hypothetical protein